MAVTLSKNGGKSDLLLFFDESGTPKYLTGREPCLMPTLLTTSLHLRLFPHQASFMFFLQFIYRTKIFLKSSIMPRILLFFKAIKEN